jgi:hypothetical protein
MKVASQVDPSVLLFLCHLDLLEVHKSAWFHLHKSAGNHQHASLPPVPCYVIDIFVANTNNHPISIYQMINDNYNPSTAENTQVTVAVYWDASQDVATTCLMSGSVDISHIMEATSLFSSGYDNSNLHGGNQ